MIHVRCNLCGRDDWQVRFATSIQESDLPDVRNFRCTCAGYGSHAQIVQCRHCGHVYANPRWVGDELLQAYAAVVDETYHQERAGRRKTFAKHLQALENVVGAANGRRLLDVGAYTGVFVEVAKDAGWKAEGIEPSAWAAKVARENGQLVHQGTLDTPELQGRSFDVITMWDVIEHLDDPSAEVGKILKLLEPGGIFAVHTMDIDSPIARVMGPRWPWLMDMHVHYFSRRTMALLLEQNGFENIWVGAQGRYLSLGYLATRVAGISRPLGRLLKGMIQRIGVAEVMVPVNLGDLFTVYARRPLPSKAIH